MYYGLKQGQITQNVDNKYVLKLIHLVAQCSKITNTMLFLLRGLHFSAFCCFLLLMSECPKVHYVALGFIYKLIHACFISYSIGEFKQECEILKFLLNSVLLVYNNSSLFFA